MDQEVDGEVLIGRALLRLQDGVAMAMSRVCQRVVQSFVVLSSVFLLLWVASFLYGSFYYSYMPKAAFSTPVHYYYRTNCDSPASFLCSYPVANISLMRNRKHVLTFGQAYRISLHLEMPDCPANQELGMFMIKTSCFSQDGGQVTSSARSASELLPASGSRFVSTALTHNNLLITQPGQTQIRAAYALLLSSTATEGDLSAQSMLRYRSDLLKYLETLLFLPAFLSGAAEQKQMLEVELFSGYTDDPYSPSVTAVIEILSNKVQIYSSHLFIHAHFTGLRYLMFNFPLLSALVGISSNFIFLSLLFVLSYMQLLLKHRTDGLSDRDKNMKNNQQEDVKDAAAGAAERLGPLQINPTNLSQQKPHLHVHNRQTRSELSESEASPGH